jgi:hypothetical protein
MAGFYFSNAPPELIFVLPTLVVGRGDSGSFFVEIVWLRWRLGFAVFERK